MDSSKRIISAMIRYFLVPLLAVIFGFFICSIIMIISWQDPVKAFHALFEGAGLFGNIRRFGYTLLAMTPLILTGLSVALAFRTGLFNIGAAGQMLMGGFTAVLVGISFTNLPIIIHLPLAVISALVAGSLWAFIPGLLKARYRVHEVVSTIMMNWISMWSVYYFVPKLIKGGYETESLPIQETASLRTDFLTNLFEGTDVNLGIFISILSIIVVWWLLDKTTFGYELKATGFNKDSAKYAGMKVNRNIILSMMISGGLAGLAGATYYLGFTNKIIIGSLPSQGYDGISVALIGANHPVGILVSSFLLAIIQSGSDQMDAIANVPNEFVSIIVAVIILFAATNKTMKLWLDKFKKIIFRR
ncbi:MAG: ABC transporter permease [Clostridiales bacterium]